MSKEELIIGFFEKGYCCDLDEVKDTCLGLLKENEKLKAELQLYKGSLKREHEAIHRVNDLEEVIKKAIEYIESKNNGHCIINGEEKGAFTFVLDFDEAREFIWELLDILKEVE